VISPTEFRNTCEFLQIWSSLFLNLTFEKKKTFQYFNNGISFLLYYGFYYIIFAPSL